LLRADLLRPWAHWVTPAGEPRRYDTRFFIAALPPGQVTRDVTSEADVVEWVRPADAIAQAAAGERLMMPPTIATCEQNAADRRAAGGRAAGSPDRPAGAEPGRPRGAHRAARRPGHADRRRPVSAPAYGRLRMVTAYA